MLNYIRAFFVCSLIFDLQNGRFNISNNQGCQSNMYNKIKQCWLNPQAAVLYLVTKLQVITEGKAKFYSQLQFNSASPVMKSNAKASDQASKASFIAIYGFIVLSEKGEKREDYLNDTMSSKFLLAAMKANVYFLPWYMR